MDGVKIMKHYTNKKTNEVFGYESFEVAEEYNDDHENLVEMTDEQFIEFRDHRPKGGKWTYQGWVIDDDLLAEAEAEEKAREEQEKLKVIDDLKLQLRVHLLMGEEEEAKEIVLQMRSLE